MDGVSFSIDQGEILSIIGPNGAGKTSVFNCITRIYDPTGTFIRQGWEVDHPGVAKHVEIIRQYAGMENASNLTLYGQYLGELMEQALILAGKDLTREGLIKAVESIKDFTCSMCLVSVTMSWSDHDPMQGAYLMRAEGGRWKTFGGLISYEGTLPDTMTVADLKK